MKNFIKIVTVMAVFISLILSMFYLPTKKVDVNAAISTTKWVRKSTPILDGKMDSKYTQSGNYKVDLYNQSIGGVKMTPGQIWLTETTAGVQEWGDEITAKSDITAFSYMLWDGIYLYVFVQVNDKKVIKVPDSHFLNNNDIVGPKGSSYHAPAIENYYKFSHTGYAGVTVKTRIEAFGRFGYAWHDPNFNKLPIGASNQTEYKTVVTPGVGYTVEYRMALGKLKDDQTFSYTLSVTHLDADGRLVGLGTQEDMDTALNSGFRLAKDTSGIKNGWLLENGKDVFYVNNVKVVNQLKEIGTGAWYLFDASGYLKKGLQTATNGQKYLFDTISGRSLMGIQDIDAAKNKAYFGSKGYMEKNKFVEDLNTKPSSWYYFGVDGLALRNTTKEFNGIKITFRPSGTIVNGFYDINIAKGTGVNPSSATSSVSSASSSEGISQGTKSSTDSTSTSEISTQTSSAADSTANSESNVESKGESISDSSSESKSTGDKTTGESNLLLIVGIVAAAIVACGIIAFVISKKVKK